MIPDILDGEIEAEIAIGGAAVFAGFEQAQIQMNPRAAQHQHAAFARDRDRLAAVRMEKIDTT
jgi:hypothetical protein